MLKIKKLGVLICVCAMAFKGCATKCPKGRLFEPKQVFSYPKWPQFIGWDIQNSLRIKMLEELRGH